MGGYKDMMHMIGNFKHVPTVLENLHKMKGKGGNKYYHGGKKHYNTGGMMDSGISTAGGGSYQGLTPYGYEGTLEHPLISPKVQAYNTGGTVSPTDPPTDPPITEETFLRQLMKESDFRSDVTSSAGAVSMAQITPDTFQDGLDKGYVPKGTTIKDLINDHNLARQFQEAYMNDLYGRDWNKGDDKVKVAKSLAAYNMGPTGLVNFLNEQKAKGVDIYSEEAMSEWISGLNEETKGYVNTILFGGDERFETDFEKLSSGYRTSTPSGSGGEEEYKYGGKMRSYKKGGKFQNGGDFLPYSERAVSSERGTFPRMKYEDSEEFPNLHLNEQAFIAVSMAKYYGYDGEIEMTSGQRGSKDQQRVFAAYQYGDHNVYRRFPQYQKAIADSLGVSLRDYQRGNYDKKQWNNADWEIAENYIDDVWDKLQNNEISLQEASKLFPLGHMEGASADFVGGFRNWLNSDKSEQFRKDFNVKVLDEHDHFHVTFGGADINTLTEENKANYEVHSSQFNNLKQEGSVSGTEVISMNPSDYKQTDEAGVSTYDDVLFGPRTEPLPMKEVSLNVETPEPTVTGATMPAGYSEYQSYLEEQKRRPGYKMAEHFGYMDKYDKNYPTLSFDEWIQENPEYMEQAGTVPVNPYQTQNISDVDWTGDPIQDIYKMSQFSRAKAPSKSVIQSPNPEEGQLNIPTDSNPYQLENPSVPNMPYDSPTKVPFFETEEGKKFAEYAEKHFGPNWQDVFKKKRIGESEYGPFNPPPAEPQPWAPKWPKYGPHNPEIGPPQPWAPWQGEVPSGPPQQLPSPYNPYDPRIGDEPSMWALLDEDAISDEVEKIKKMAY